MIKRQNDNHSNLKIQNDNDNMPTKNNVIYKGHNKKY